MKFQSSVSLSFPGHLTFSIEDGDHLEQMLRKTPKTVSHFLAGIEGRGRSQNSDG